MYHLMATCPIVYLVWPQIYRCMLACTGRHLSITDELIFSNRVKSKEWRSYSKAERVTASTLMAVGRRTLYGPTMLALTVTLPNRKTWS